MTPLIYLVAREQICDQIERASVRAVPDVPQMRLRVRRALRRSAT